MNSKYHPAPEGRVYGGWTVESYSHFTNEHYWNVKCSCGKIHKRRASQLTLGRSNSCRSCAASNREGKKIVAWVFVGDMSANYLTRITHSARSRGIKMSISTKDLYDQWILQDSICALSGIPLILQKRGVKSTGTASVDRIDSNRGYEVGNIQWVSKEVNIMKHSIEEGEFILLCRMIADYRGGVREKEWCKHEKTKSVYHAFSSPPEIVQCCLCGACHVERSWTDHDGRGGCNAV